MWNMELLLRKRTGSDKEIPQFESFSELVDFHYEKYIEVSNKKFNPNYSNNSFANGLYHRERSLFEACFLISLSEHCQETLDLLLLYIPDEKEREYLDRTEAFRHAVGELYRRYPSPSRDSLLQQQLLELEKTFPKRESNMARALSLLPHLEDHINELPDSKSFAEVALSYEYSLGFNSSILLWGNPRLASLEMDIHDWLTHTTNSQEKIISDNQVGTIVGGRCLSTSISRITMDRKDVVLFHAHTLAAAGIPLIRVDEARDSKALREVITWPLPLSLAALVPTDAFPDKHMTNNMPNSNKGSYYGEASIRSLL